VHRTLRYLIRKRDFRDHVDNPGKLEAIPKKAIIPYSQEQMAALGEHCSITERRADEATRDVEQWLKCQYMEDHLGDEFTGVVSGVAPFGLFVTLSDLYIDGMVHVSGLESDYYHHDEVRHALVGESSGRMYRLGDEVRVQVAGVNTEDRKIDLLMLEGPSPGRRQSRGRKKQASGGPERQKLARKKAAGKKSAPKKSAGKKAAQKKGAPKKAAKKSSGRGRRR
jgi:ribonuclease R